MEQQRTGASVRHPEVTVALIDEVDGNAFAVLGAVQQALREAGVDREEIAEFIREATTGDYDDLLMTVLAWVEVR
jgi:hypothetical protein